MKSAEEVASIVAKVRAGDREAFAFIVEHYARQVRNVVAKFVPVDEVESVVQETFIGAFLSFASLRDAKMLGAWLRGIATRKSYDLLRNRYRSSRKVGEWSDGFGHAVVQSLRVETLSPEDRVAVKELVDRILNHLSPVDRMLVVLLYFEELSVKEAAIELGWSTTYVKVHSMRVRKKMRLLADRLMELNHD